MGVDGECRTLVRHTLILALILGPLSIDTALAQRDASGAEEVRKRRAAAQASRNPYWDGFILKHEGNCLEAISKLMPIAERGFGYEDAQIALGECYLDKAGLSGAGGTPPKRADIVDNQDFKYGLKWIGSAANAGHFEAQAIMVNLYAVGLGPDEDNQEAAKWAHLYMTNPQRLNLGAPIVVHDALSSLQEQMAKDDWLLGKERARVWVPVYVKAKTPEANGDAKKP